MFKIFQAHVARRFNVIVARALGTGEVTERGVFYLGMHRSAEHFFRPEKSHCRAAEFSHPARLFESSCAMLTLKSFDFKCTVMGGKCQWGNICNTMIFNQITSLFHLLVFLYSARRPARGPIEVSILILTLRQAGQRVSAERQ